MGERPTPASPGPVIVIRHSHMDQEWITTFGRSLPRFVSVLERILARLEADPGERFLLDGIPLLAAALDGEGPESSMAYGSPYHRLYTAGLELGHPGLARPWNAVELRRRVRGAVARDQLEIVGTFTQPDTNLPAGEALVRQGLVARSWYRDTLGVEPTVAWNLDSFGQSAQLPQILAQCGYDALLAFRIAPTEDPGVSAGPEGLGSSFLFHGLDGTEIPTHALPEGYSPGVVRIPRLLSRYSAGTRLVEAARRLADEAGTLPVLLPFGAEYSPPLPGIGTLLRRIRAALPDRRVELGSARAFFDDLARVRGRLQVHGGDLNPVFPGTHALRPGLKRADRVATSTVLAAEMLDALLAARGNEDTTRSRAAARAWIPLLTNHAHDSIGGCHAAAVTVDVAGRYRAATRGARTALDRGLARLAPAMPRGSHPVVLFNPLGWERTDVALVPWSGPTPGLLRGPDGAPLPFSVSTTGGPGLLAVRATVPGLGHAVLAAEHGTRVREPGDGGTRVRELVAGRTRVRPLPGGRIELATDDGRVAVVGRPRLEEDRGNAYLPRVGAALDEMATSPWRFDEDPLGTTAVCEGALGGQPLRLTLRKVPGRDWIGLALEGGPVAAGRRVRLPIRKARQGPTPYEIPFGEMDRQGPVAVQGYVRLEGDAGVANLGCPAHEIGSDSVDIVLLRSIRLLSQRRPLLRLRIPIDATVDAPWRMDLALAADARRAARELCQPLVGAVLGAESARRDQPWSDTSAVAPRETGDGRGKLAMPLSRGLFPPLDAPSSVEVVALKRSEDGRAIAVRLLQMADEPATAWMTTPGPGRVELADAAERVVRSLRRRKGRIRVELGPWQLVTLLWHARALGDTGRET